MKLILLLSLFIGGLFGCAGKTKLTSESRLPTSEAGDASALEFPTEFPQSITSSERNFRFAACDEFQTPANNSACLKYFKFEHVTAEKITACHRAASAPANVETCLYSATNPSISPEIIRICGEITSTPASFQICFSKTLQLNLNKDHLLLCADKWGPGPFENCLNEVISLSQ